MIYDIDYDAGDSPAYPKLIPSFDWGAVEILGHRRHLGAIGEVERFGVKMLCIHEPKIENGKMVSFDVLYYGAASIFSVRSLTPEAIIEALTPFRFSRIPLFDDDEGGSDDGR